MCRRLLGLAAAMVSVVAALALALVAASPAARASRDASACTWLVRFQVAGHLGRTTLHVCTTGRVVERAVLDTGVWCSSGVLSRSTMRRLRALLDEARFPTLRPSYLSPPKSFTSSSYSVTYRGRKVVTHYEAVRSGRVPARLVRVINLLSSVADQVGDDNPRPCPR
jgi:hypothetical protein